MSSDPVKPYRSYDQVLSGDVTIKKIRNNDYKITFSKKNISNMLMYQVYSKDYATLNKHRRAVYIKATDWVKSVFAYTFPNSFRPTTIMEFSNKECPFHHQGKECGFDYDVCRHIFVINYAKVNNKGQVVFYVSTNNIVLPKNANKQNKQHKKLKEIPQGEFHNVRFDIDAVDGVAIADGVGEAILDALLDCKW